MQIQQVTCLKYCDKPLIVVKVVVFPKWLGVCSCFGPKHLANKVSASSVARELHHITLSPNTGCEICHSNLPFNESYYTTFGNHNGGLPIHSDSCIYLVQWEISTECICTHFSNRHLHALMVFEHITFTFH